FSRDWSSDVCSSDLLSTPTMSSPGPMKLYASGFNAWNQLVFDEKDIRDEPDDIRSFEVVLEGGDIELPISRLSYTLGAFGPIVQIGRASCRERVRIA